MNTPTAAALIRAMERRDVLTEEEKAALDGLAWTLKDYPPDAEIVAEGSRPSQSCLLVSGMCARSNFLPDGGRQLTAVHVAGDFVDLHGLFLKLMDHSVVSLTECRVAFVPHAAVRDITAKFPHLSRMLSLLIAVDAAVERQWMLGLGRRSSEARLAHLLCELHLRLKIINETTDGGFSFPLSQAILADILGLSTVHTNRTVQRLRTLGLIRWREKELEILDWEGLAGFSTSNAGPLWEPLCISGNWDERGW